MNEIPSRGERFINHIIDARNQQMNKLAASGKDNNGWVPEAIYYDTLANKPDVTESIEESEDLGIPRTRTLFLLEAKNPEKDYEEKYAQDKHFPDNPVGDLPV